MNVSGRPASRNPASTSKSAASARLGISRPASRDAWSKSLCSSTDNARASRPACPAADGAGGESSGRPFVRRFSRRGAQPPRSERSAPSLSASTSSCSKNGIPSRRAQAGIDKERIRNARRASIPQAGQPLLASAERGGSLQRTDRSSPSQATQHRCPPREGGSPGRARRPALRVASAGRRGNAEKGRLPNARRRRPRKGDPRRPGSRTTSRGRAGSRTKNRHPTGGGLSAAGAPKSPSRPAARPAAPCSRSARSSSDTSASGGSKS